MDFLSSKDIALEQLMPLIRTQLASGKSVRFSPRGISMLPMLRQGIDSVVLSPVPERLKKYDLPLYQRSTGEYVLHRVVKAGESYTCIGDNQFAYESGLQHSQMIALVTAFYRRKKRWEVTQALYRCYCVLWHRTRSMRHFCLRCVRWAKRCARKVLKRHQ